HPKPPTQDPTPHTPHPTPHTPHPTPHTPHPTPHTPHPTPHTPHPNPKPHTPHPKPKPPNPNRSRRQLCEVLDSYGASSSSEDAPAGGLPSLVAFYDELVVRTTLETLNPSIYCIDTPPPLECSAATGVSRRIPPAYGMAGFLFVVFFITLDIGLK
ncbi:hypothetical protein T484DRAFT_1641853, partial [Baffinella frigidus]